VGSSINLGRRLSEYFNKRYLEVRTKKKSIICNALLKYGHVVFSLAILEYCKPEDCTKLEQHYIDLLNPVYNILLTAGSRLGKKHSDETLAKMRDRKHTEETRAKLAIARLGKKLTEKTRTKIAIARLGKKHNEKTLAKMRNHKPSEETRAKMSAAKKGNKIEVLSLETKKTTTYDSINAAAKALSIKQSRISMYFHNNQKAPFKGIYIFKKLYSTKANTNSKIFTFYSNKKNLKVYNNHLLDNKSLVQNQLMDNKPLLQKHFPVATREWNNSIYSFDKNEMRSINNFDLIISRLFKIYFSSIPYILKHNVTRKQRFLMKDKVYMSKPELKHTTSNVLITLYLYADRRIDLRLLFKGVNRKTDRLARK